MSWCFESRISKKCSKADTGRISLEGHGRAIDDMGRSEQKKLNVEPISEAFRGEYFIPETLYLATARSPS